MTTRAVDRLLQTSLVLTLLLSAAGAALALVFIGQDAGTSGEFLDGLGVVIGLVLLGVVGVPAATAGWALRRSLRGDPRAWAWAVASAALGLAAVAVLAFPVHPVSLAAVPEVVVLVAAVAARRPAAPPRPAGGR
jgi:hypothetical protein